MIGKDKKCQNHFIWNLMRSFFSEEGEHSDQTTKNFYAQKKWEKWEKTTKISNGKWATKKLMKKELNSTTLMIIYATLHEVTFYTNIPSKIVIAQNDDDDDEKRCKRPEKRK